MTVEEALIIVDSVLKPAYLNHVQELVLRQSWEGKTYPEMAASSCYDAEYIKNIGYHLWQSLSEKLGEKVTKSNFRSVLRRYSFSKNQSNAGNPFSAKAGLSLALPEEEQEEIPAGNSIFVVFEQERVKSQKSNQKLSAAAQNGFHPAATEKEWEKQKAGERESKVAVEFWLSRDLPSANYSSPVTVNLRQDWEKAIDVSVFYGRSSELATLEQWIVEEGCRLVAILGMGGIGKTALSLKLAERICGKFDYLIWRSLRNAPPLTQFLSSLLQFLFEGRFQDESATVDEKIQVLMEYFQKHRCLLVLDGAEAILRGGDELLSAGAGYYREGYDGYGELFKRLGEESHHSCLVLTSREQPNELAFLIGRKVRSLPLSGLPHSAAQGIFKERGCFVEPENKWREVTQMYQGNPLALKIVSTTIQDLFDGNVAEFLSQNTAVYGNVRDLLNQQFDRLSDTEKEIMYWLAAEREAVSLQELRQNLKSDLSPTLLLESLESLKRRSLIETKSGYFTQQSVVKEYIKNRLLPANKLYKSVDGREGLKKLLQNKNSVLHI